MPSTTVGNLNAQLRADIAEFTKNMKEAGFASEGFANQMTAAGQKFSEAGVRFGATNRLVAEFKGTLDVRRAEEYAAAMEKIGDASRLTAADQAKLNAVMEDAIAHLTAAGQKIPEHFQKWADATKGARDGTDFLADSWAKLVSAFSAANLIEKAAGMLVDFGKAAVANAGRLDDLSAKTGLSVETLQRMDYVARQSGATMDDFASSVYKMGINVEKGGTEVKAAVEAMHVSFADFKRMGVEEQFQTIVNHLQDFGSETERNTALQAIFGKGAERIVASLTSNYKHLADAAEVASEAQIKALKSSADAWEAYWKNVETRTTAALGNEIRILQLLKTDFFGAIKAELTAGVAAQAQYLDGLEQIATFGKKAANAGKDVVLTAPPVKSLTEELKAAQASMAKLTAEERANIVAGVAMNETTDNILKSLQAQHAQTTATAAGIDLYKKALQEAKQAAEKAAETAKQAAKKQEEAEKQLEKAMADWRAEVVRGVVPVGTMLTAIGNITRSFNAAHVAAQAFAQAHRELGVEINDAVFQMVRDGIAAGEVFAKLKAGGQAFDDQKESIDNLAKGYTAWRIEVDKGEKSAVEMVTAIGHVRTALDASQVAAQALTESHRKLTPATVAAAEAMFAEGRNAEYVFQALKAKGLAQDADKVKIEELAKAHAGLTQTLGELSAAFATMAQIGGESFGGILKGIGGAISGMSTVATALDKIKTLTAGAGPGTGGWTAASIAGMVASYATVVGAIYQVWSAFDAYYKKQQQITTIEHDAGQAAYDFGIAFGRVSDQVAVGVRKSLDELMRLGGGIKQASDINKYWLQAEALHLIDIIKEIGGVTAQNLPLVIDHFRALVDLAKQGGTVGAEALRQMEGALPAIVKGATDATGLWDASLKKLIADAKAAGVELQAVADVIQAQQEKLAGGVTGLTASTGGQAARYTELKAKVDDATKALADLVAQGAKQEDIATATEAVKKAQADLATVTVTTQEEFDRLSRISLAAFNGLVASGVDVVTAMQQIGPGIDNLIASATAFGLAGNAAFDQLARWRDLTKANEPLLQQIGSLNDIMVTLSNLGSITADTFADIEAQGSSAFDKLTAAGFTENEALVQMKPFLETVLKLSRERGFTIDDNTAKLIAQATEQGILDEKQLSTNDILMQGLTALLEGLGIKVPEAWKKATDAAKTSADQSVDALVKTGKAGEDAARRTETAWNQVEITVPVKFDMPGLPESSGGGAGPSPSPQSAANEGFFRMPKTIRVGDDPFSEGEFVLHKRTLERLVAAAAAAGTQGSSDLSAALATLPAPIAFPPAEVLAAAAPPVLSAVGSVPTKGGGGTVIVTLDRRFLAQVVVPELEGEVRRLGFGK